MRWFKNKRGQIAKALAKNSALILASLPEYFRQTDIKYPYRQDSNFYYLTGFEQANSLFALLPSGRSILFSANKDPVKEAWEGPLLSSQEIKRRFLIDEAYYLSELDRILGQKLKGLTRIFYDPGSPLFDKKIKSLKIRPMSAGELLKPFRRIKDKTEIASIKKAVKAGIFAHKRAAQALRPGASERALHGIFIQSIMARGSAREPYGGIFACGANATTLHYTKNNSVCKKGELLLIDAGAEIDYYSSDITRVYPVSGKFSPPQKRLYESLLDLQKKLIEEARPGASLKQINQKMFEGITRILIDEGILRGTLKGALGAKAYKKYCPHSVGHLLGLDVHDVTFKKTEKGVLKPGMALTIEPGIYISSSDTKAPKSLRGLGLRIEDDILVTASGHENLTKNMPKETAEIEKLCSQ